MPDVPGNATQRGARIGLAGFRVSRHQLKLISSALNVIKPGAVAAPDRIADVAVEIRRDCLRPAAVALAHVEPRHLVALPAIVEAQPRQACSVRRDHRMEVRSAAVAGEAPLVMVHVLAVDVAAPLLGVHGDMAGEDGVHVVALEEREQAVDALVKSAQDLEQSLTGQIGTLQRKAVEFNSVTVVPANEVTTDAHVESLKQIVQERMTALEEDFTHRQENLELVVKANIEQIEATANGEIEPTRKKIEEGKKAVEAQFADLIQKQRAARRQLAQGVLVLERNSVGIDEGKDVAHEVSLYPNPATDVIHFTLPAVKGEVEVAVFDINGRKIISRQLQSSVNGEVHVMDVQHLPSGMYILHANVEGADTKVRFVKH